MQSIRSIIVATLARLACTEGAWRESGTGWRVRGLVAPSAVLQRTSDARIFFRSPSKYALERPSCICLFTPGGTFCMVARGDVGATEIEDYIAALAHAPVGAKRAQLIDLRRVGRYSRGAMDALVRFYKGDPAYAGSSRVANEIQREAVVRPGGAVGAFAEGFFRVNPMPFEARVFEHAEDAFAWLDDPSGWGALPVPEWLARHPSLGRLEDFIRARGAQATLDDCARALGLSGRTLQRRLQAQHLEFRSLRQRTLVAEAQRRLIETDAPIKAISIELGFKSAARFNEAFRRELACSPSDYRKRRS